MRGCKRVKRRRSRAKGEKKSRKGRKGRWRGKAQKETERWAPTEIAKAWGKPNNFHETQAQPPRD